MDDLYHNTYCNPYYALNPQVNLETWQCIGDSIYCVLCLISRLSGSGGGLLGSPAGRLALRRKIAMAFSIALAVAVRGTSSCKGHKGFRSLEGYPSAGIIAGKRSTAASPHLRNASCENGKVEDICGSHPASKDGRHIWPGERPWKQLLQSPCWHISNPSSRPAASLH